MLLVKGVIITGTNFFSPVGAELRVLDADALAYSDAVVASAPNAANLARNWRRVFFDVMAVVLHENGKVGTAVYG